ncbi:GNAT family N-acetyltransferase [Shimia sp.]|uniref:GNAT family N-acetyltransferase n=1 Tax=Shimia sp. TaxID=1954381 RepID=UPI0032997226
MTELLIRRAVPDDIPAMLQVVCDWENATPWMVSVLDRAGIEASIRDVFGSREIWVAGKPVEGYLSFNPETLQVSGLYCARPGNGVGKALMDRVKQGRDAIWLRTHEPNEAAQKFYRREGFVKVSRHAPEPPNVLHELRMEWSA